MYVPQDVSLSCQQWQTHTEAKRWRNYLCKNQTLAAHSIQYTSSFHTMIIWDQYLHCCSLTPFLHQTLVPNTLISCSDGCNDWPIQLHRQNHGMTLLQFVKITVYCCHWLSTERLHRKLQGVNMTCFLICNQLVGKFALIITYNMINLQYVSLTEACIVSNYEVLLLLSCLVPLSLTRFYFVPLSTLTSFYSMCVISNLFM